MKKKALNSGKSRVGIAVVIVMAIAVCLAGWYFARRHSSTGTVRNVVLISIDTCRADHLSCYGYKRLTTPNVDSVARAGVLFKSALTPVPLTMPAHSSMLTGTYPPTHGARLNDGYSLSAGNVTLAEIMREAGYQTAAFVGGFPLDQGFGLNQGFDTYDCKFTIKNEQWLWGNQRTAGEVNRSALAWLQGHARKPFFLFLHYFDAHYPYEPPLPYARDYAGDLYAGEIAYVDHCIGEVLKKLRDSGAEDNTLIIITGDHGEDLGEHGEPYHGYFIYQATQHVPLVIRAPRNSKGWQVEDNVSLVDIMPTVLDVVGLKTPPKVEGVSLRHYLEGSPRSARGGKTSEQPRQIYCESLEPATFQCSSLRSVVEAGWKYIRAPKEELYDLKHDPVEKTNLIEKEPQLARRLRGRLETMTQKMESAAPGRRQSDVDPETVKRLQSLGYVGGGAKPATLALDATLEDPKDFLPTYVRFDKARSAFYGKHREEAKKALLELIASRPTFIAAHGMLAVIALAEHRLANAAEYCSRIVEILSSSKASTEPPLTTGNNLTADLAEAHFNLANVLQQMGKFAEAIGHYEEAVRMRPDYQQARINIGLALVQSGKCAQAIGHYEEALRLKPDSVEVHVDLGLALVQSGKFAEAIGHYEEALRVKPDCVEAHYNLGRLLQQTGELTEAIGHYESCLRLKPEFAKATPDLESDLAEARTAQGAIERYEQVLRTRPDDVEAHNGLGNVLQQIGRAEEAIPHFREAARIRPNDGTAHYNLAVALEQRGKATEAIGHYEEALRLKPDFLLALNNLSWIRATSAVSKLRDGAEAVRLAENACQFTKHKQSALLDTLAAAYAEAGKFQEAVATAEEGIALAKAGGKSALVAEIQARVELYRSGKPYREPPRTMPVVGE